MGVVKARGSSFYYEEKGEGLPILLIPPSGPAALTWGALVGDLAGAGRVIAYDRRGYRQGDHRGRRVGRHRHGPHPARPHARPASRQGLQLAIEYDPQPPFDMGSPSKGPAEIVEFVRSQLNALAAPEPASSG
jgi:hypothetical protein